MTVNAAAGAKIFIGTSAIPTIPSDYVYADVLAEFEADSYIEIGEVEDLGEFGDESESIPFTSLGDSRTRKFKGPRDAGDMALTVGDDVLDDGQAACEAAEATPLDYNFKIVLNDARTIGGDNSVSYFYGKVMSKRKAIGQANSIVRRNFSVGINSPIISTDPS